MSGPKQPAGVLEVRHVSKTFRRSGAVVNAVTDVSFTIGESETVALIGESGSGKSTIGRLILALYPLDSGEVIFEGRSLADRSREEMRRVRARLQVVFQEPYQSLNPKQTVFKTIEEPLLVQGESDRAVRRKRSRELLELVGLDVRLGERYPGELSGGQQQRVGIARAIVGNPQLVVLDEPTASLDRTTRAQVAGLLERLQRELNLSYLLITHDIGSVRRMAARIQVLLHGRLVEGGTTQEVLSNPSHPYTKALISAELSPRPGRRGDRYRLKPAAAVDNLITGCPLAPTCPLVIPACSDGMPPMFEVSATHTSACLRYEEVARGPAGAEAAASGAERQAGANGDKMSEQAGAPDMAPGGDRP